LSPPPIDTLRALASPEGVELPLSLAGPIPRALAWFTDFLLRVLIFMALALVLGALLEIGQGLLFLLYFVLEWLYPILFERLANGATPGKKMMHLRVLRDDGAPLTWRSSIVRNLLRTVDFLPFLYATGFVAICLNRDFKRLGDLAAGTIVVHVPALDARRSIRPQYAAIPPLAPAIGLELTEERALLEYAARRHLWSDARAAELAQIAKPLLSPTNRASGADDLQDVNHLIAQANYLAGR
jgi:uncharacterized RDD family membrane protein YckC